jgi:predicted dehydrogenase
VTDYRSVLSDSRIDAVVIATPPNTHANLTIASFEAGKHVFVEKPMALCSADASRVVHAAKRAGKRGMVGYVMLHHPAVTQLKQWIDDGVLGEVRRIIATRRGPTGGPNEPGPWWSLAPHDVSLACFLLGREPRSIALAQRMDGTATTIRARLTFGGGCVGEIAAAAGAIAKVRRVVVQGTRASALFDDTRSTEKLVLLTTTRDGLSAATTPDLPIFEALHVELAHFVDAISSDRRFLSDVQTGARVVHLLEAGAASAARARKFQPVVMPWPHDEAKSHLGTIVPNSGV